ncbi:hypothetical protein AB205_0076570 [Aquarana catesbeiana]|uniref:Uncharacterized protein n=1 Tax=Aquarana catesbeiana TaxID=8400 RepID=A0A2G9R4H9_AQUCT|nr:hypothetical protein AB205_0076570 [Aquarana catesbeiana]
MPQVYTIDYPNGTVTTISNFTLRVPRGMEEKVVCVVSHPALPSDKYLSEFLKDTRFSFRRQHMLYKQISEGFIAKWKSMSKLQRAANLIGQGRGFQSLVYKIAEIWVQKFSLKYIPPFPPGIEIHFGCTKPRYDLIEVVMTSSLSREGGTQQAPPTTGFLQKSTGGGGAKTSHPAIVEQ